MSMGPRAALLLAAASIDTAAATAEKDASFAMLDDPAPDSTDDPPFVASRKAVRADEAAAAGEAAAGDKGVPSAASSVARTASPTAAAAEPAAQGSVDKNAPAVASRNAHLLRFKRPERGQNQHAQQKHGAAPA